MTLRLRRGRGLAAAIAAAGLVTATFTILAPMVANATPVAREVRVDSTDWTAGAVGGIGSDSSGGGSGDITISGISGTVTGAWLSWHGIGPDAGGVYSSGSITVNGSPVVGASAGESGSNCWGGARTSRTYMADVESIVAPTGNGTYSLAGLGAGGDDANGANLVVTFDDGDTTNDRDLYLYYGNDSQAGPFDGFPGEDSVWAAALTDLNYIGGTANLLAAVADGQNFGPSGDDDSFDVTGAGGTLFFPDDATNDFMWDGATVPDAGHSRAGNGSLFDMKSFDVTGAFGAPGVQDLSVHQDITSDCLALIMAAVDLPASGEQPPPPETVSVYPAGVVEGTAPLPQGKFTKMKFKVTLSSKATSPVSVTLHTEDGTAFAPSDYKSKSQTIVIPIGKRTKVFKVNVVPDPFSEGDEFFYAVIDSASVPVATGTAVGEIIDDDGAAEAWKGKSKKNKKANGGVRR